MHKYIYAVFLFIFLANSLGTRAQVNLSSGQVAYYPFNGTFNDASGNGNHGTPLNGVTFGTDQWGNTNNAAFFDGLNDWINVASPSFTFGKNFSVAFRFKSASTIHQVLLSKSNYATAPTNLQFQVAFNHPINTLKGIYLATNHTGTCTYGPTGVMDHFGTTTPTISSGQWYCVVMTFQNGVKSIYVNGVLEYQATVTGVANPTSTDSCVNSAFRIGSWWQNDPRYFSGLMDEVRLWNRAINTQEVDSLCNLTTGPELIPNKYAAVTGRPSCSNTFTVDTATGFSTGDTVLMIQMKGATIDTSNTASFGSILSYNGAGNYEFNVVKSVAGNSITLLYNLHKSYDIPNGRVQLIRVPYYSNYTVNQSHSCVPWNGSKGGVLVLNASGTITLNAPIDVSRRGFRAGNLAYVVSAPCGATNYYYASTANHSGAQKGEGIATVSSNRDHGRGALANGGGGGNSSNGGGGGGSNAGVGGVGGKETALCTPALASGGIGGVALTYSNTANRVFMGGGAGAGHANNADGGTGGNGGGIVFLFANQLIGNNNLISADGETGNGCIGDCWDGQPGGGGGGSVMLNVNSYSTNVQTTAIGGKGGSFGNSNATAGPNGPGGGGGGGAVWLKSATRPSQVLPNVAGGTKGYFNVTNNWGTADGDTGVVLTGLQLPVINPVDTFVSNSIVVGFTDSQVTCTTRIFVNTTSTSGIGVRTWSWTFGDGGSSTSQTPTYTYGTPGTYNVKLVVTDSNGCKDSLIKSVSAVCGDTIINRYAAVLAYGLCNNTYTVDTAAGFFAGDTILIIQMKGATVDTSNSSSFGSISSYNSAGLYEYNVIQTVSGNNITLRFTTLRGYNIPNGRVQFIKTPSFGNYNVSRGISCLPWTGTKGGVVAMRVAGTLTLNANIDVSGKGFVGGQPLYSNITNCNKTDYFYGGAGNEGSRKGEGITELSPSKSYGRGAQANGGGGGNDNGSGGGGGSNYSAGGLGGNQSQIGSCATTANIGGVGGRALTSSPFSRAFMGGGGGAGHGDDTAEKAGGNGGGIILIKALVIAGNNFALRANGAAAPQCNAPGVIGGGCANDGGGGGGGGGLIYSTASSVSNLSVQATGGKGSNVYVIGDPAVGPGGGGSGGAWAFVPGSLAPSVTFSGTGGAAGVLPQLANSNYGAQPGANGQTYAASSTVPTANVVFSGNILNLAFTDSTLSCFGRTLINKTTSASAAPVAYNWFFPGGSTSALANPSFTFPGYGTHLVTLNAIDSNGCSASLARFVNIPYVHFALGAGDTAMCTAKPVILRASGGISYAWTPASGLSAPNAATTTANPTVTTSYKVIVVDSVGCVDSDYVTITVAAAGNGVKATPADSAICDGDKVRLKAVGAISYQWTPGEGLDNPAISAPTLTVTRDQQYIVTGLDSAGCISSDTVNITKRNLPDVQASAEGIGSKCEEKSVLLRAAGTAGSYFWLPSAHLSNSGNNNTVVYARPPVTTLYTLTGRDANGCAGTDTVTAFVSDEVVVRMPDAFSPNGDSRNDIIRPMAFCDFTIGEYRIYDRWGREVFSSGTLSGGWDGTRNGQQADVGTYHYIIVGKRASNNEQVTFKGNFLLMR